MFKFNGNSVEIMAQLQDTDFGLDENRITRAKAIRLKCLDCCCGQRTEVKKCPVRTCPLWRYRMGHEQKEEREDG